MSLRSTTLFLRSNLDVHNSDHTNCTCTNPLPADVLAYVRLHFSKISKTNDGKYELVLGDHLTRDKRNKSKWTTRKWNILIESNGTIFHFGPGREINRK